MTRERMEMYQSNKEEIQELTYKLAHLRENMVGNSVILDGRTGIPRPSSAWTKIFYRDGEKDTRNGKQRWSRSAKRSKAILRV